MACLACPAAVTEYVSRGEMMTLWKKARSFPESLVKIHVAQLVLAIGAHQEPMVAFEYGALADSKNSLQISCTALGSSTEI